MAVIVLPREIPEVKTHGQFLLSIGGRGGPQA